MCLPTSEAACSSLGRGECLSACFRARSNSGGSLAGPEDDEAVKSRLLASGAAEAASQGDLPRLLGLLGWRLPFLACDTVSLDQSFRAACHHFRPGQDRAPSFVAHARAATLLLVVCGALHRASASPVPVVPGHAAVLRFSTPASLALRVIRNRLVLRTSRLSDPEPSAVATDGVPTPVGTTGEERAPPSAAAPFASPPPPPRKAQQCLFPAEPAPPSTPPHGAHPLSSAAVPPSPRCDTPRLPAACEADADDAIILTDVDPNAALLDFLADCSLSGVLIDMSPRSSKRSAKLVHRRSSGGTEAAAGEEAGAPGECESPPTPTEKWALALIAAVAMES